MGAFGPPSMTADVQTHDSLQAKPDQTLTTEPRPISVCHGNMVCDCASVKIG